MILIRPQCRRHIMLSAECRHLIHCWWQHDHWPLSILTSLTSDNAAPGVVTGLLLLLSLLLLWKPSSSEEEGLGQASNSQSERSIEAADQSQAWHSWEDWGQQQQPHPQPGLNIMNRFIITSFITTNVPWTNFAFASLEITRKISKIRSKNDLTSQNEMLDQGIYLYLYVRDNLEVHRVDVVESVLAGHVPVDLVPGGWPWPGPSLHVGYRAFPPWGSEP